MKQAIIGLRKRETYEELINDLNHDPITNYPNRRASELENSPYLSQLRVGFEEMILQNDNLLKEREKEMLLHRQAGEGNLGRHELAISADRWRHHVPPSTLEIFHTPERAAPPPEPEPAGEPVTYAPGRPPIQISETRTRSARKARDRNAPIIQDAEPMIEEILPPEYNIGTPLNTPIPKRGRGRPKKVPAHDVDPHVEEAHATAIDVSERARKQQKQKSEDTMDMFLMMMEEAAQNPNMDEFMSGHGDKRREAGANPHPPKPKAKTTKPKREASPEAPRNTRASASTDVPPPATPEPKAKATPKAKAAPKKEAKPEETKPEEPKSKPIPVKKDAPKKTEQKGTSKVHHDTFEEWKRNSNKASLVDQYNLRRIGTYLASKNDMKSITVKQLIERILDHDKKNKK